MQQCIKRIEAMDKGSDARKDGKQARGIKSRYAIDSHFVLYPHLIWPARAEVDLRAEATRALSRNTQQLDALVYCIVLTIV